MSSVELLPPPTGDTVHDPLKLHPGQGGGGWDWKSNEGEIFPLLCVVEKLEEQVNTAKNLVVFNRTRCIHQSSMRWR